MRTIYYFYVLVILAAVFALNSCGGMESEEKIEKRSREAVNTFLGRSDRIFIREVEDMQIYSTDTLSADIALRRLDSALEGINFMQYAKVVEKLDQLKKQLKKQPTIIIYRWEVDTRPKFSDGYHETMYLYGIYNTKTRKVIIAEELSELWTKHIPRPYFETLFIIKSLR